MPEASFIEVEDCSELGGYVAGRAVADDGAGEVLVLGAVDLTSYVCTSFDL